MKLKRLDTSKVSVPIQKVMNLLTMENFQEKFKYKLQEQMKDKVQLHKMRIMKCNFQKKKAKMEEAQGAENYENTSINHKNI